MGAGGFLLLGEGHVIGPCRGARLDSEVEIISPEGKPVEPGEMGNVRVRNPYMIKGYLNSPEATARVQMVRDVLRHLGQPTPAAATS